MKLSHLLKEKQAQLKEKNMDYMTLVKEQVIRDKYKEAYELYENHGFKSMKTEHDSYLKAVKALKESGYISDEKDTAADFQSNAKWTLKMSGFTSDIRFFRGEIKKCNKALELSSNMQRKKEKIESCEERNKHSIEHLKEI